MVRFVLVTFGLLAWTFYVMSGGAEFQPASARLADETAQLIAATSSSTPDQPAPVDVEVTRVSLNLVGLDEAGRLRPKPVATDAPEPAGLLNAEKLAAVTGSQGESAVIIPSLVRGADPVTDVTPASFDRDLRIVTGSRVNVRAGPGTRFGVVSSLTQGTEVEVLEDAGNGWVRLRATDGDQTGWMADFLLSGG